MDLKQLQEMGAFVPPAPMEKSVSWTRVPQGADEERTDTFTIHVKKLSFGAIEELLTDDGKQSERTKMSRFIAATVLINDGKVPLSFKDAYRLDPSFASALMTVINEVNGTRDRKAATNGANGTDGAADEPAKN